MATLCQIGKINKCIDTHALNKIYFWFNISNSLSIFSVLVVNKFFFFFFLFEFSGWKCFVRNSFGCAENKMTWKSSINETGSCLSEWWWTFCSLKNIQSYTKRQGKNCFSCVSRAVLGIHATWKCIVICTLKLNTSQKIRKKTFIGKLLLFYVAFSKILFLFLRFPISFNMNLCPIRV